MQKDFEGKAVIVTGSSSGIGEGIAILFAKRGAMVTLCGRDQGRLQKAMEKCLQAGGDGNRDKYITVCGDVTDKEVREKIVNKTVEQFGRLDVLVCNHGICTSTFDFSAETEEMYDSVMNTNLKSVYFLIQRSIQHLEKYQGCIVSVSSVASTLAGFQPCYSIGKAALDHMTRLLALQLAPKEIRVNAVNPTLVLTSMIRNLDVTSGLMDQFRASHPLHGRASTVEEQANVVVFLASSKASFTTGQCVKVDGAVSLLGATLRDANK